MSFFPKNTAHDLKFQWPLLATKVASCLFNPNIVEGISSLAIGETFLNNKVRYRSVV